MRRIAAMVAIACLMPAGLGFGPPALIESSEALAPLYAEQVPAIQRFQPPALSAATAALGDGRTGTVLFDRNAQVERPMASVTKIMTALLALERGKLDQKVHVSVDAAQMIDSSVMGLRPGEELTLEDLLYGLLLPSGNDAAVAIAEHIGGSEPKFVALMNERAAQLGMVNTSFANPHGLDAPRHYSSAADLILLARKAMGSETFAKIVATREHSVQGKLATYRLRNTNLLLGEYAGVDGVKTGLTDAAGQCLVATAQRGDGRVYTAVLGSTARFADTQALLDYFYGNFACRWLAPAAGAFDRLPAGTADNSLGPVDLSTAAGPRVSEPPWRCFPLWQARWLRDAVVPDGPDGATLTFYLGDMAIATTRVTPQ